MILPVKKQFLKSTFFATCISISFSAHTAQQTKSVQVLAASAIWAGGAALWAYNSSPTFKSFFDNAMRSLTYPTINQTSVQIPQPTSSNSSLEKPADNNVSTPNPSVTTETSINNQPTNEKRAIDAIEESLSKLPAAKIIELLIAKEKSQLIREILANTSDINSSASSSASSAVSTTEDKDAHFFTPIMPRPFSSADRYIGDIPGQMQNFGFYLIKHQECLKNNVCIWNRILLYGKPGVGKTHLVKFYAQAYQVPLFSFSASHFADKYIGEASRKIRKAFDAAKSLNRPVLFFIDEIDALATKRTSSTHNEHRGTLITLLTELQEMQDNKNVLFIAATNDLESLDQAIKDRFAGSICEVKELNVAQKTALFMKFFADKGLPADLQLAARLAEITQYNFSSNRELECIVTIAKLKQFKDRTQNPEAFKKHLCTYLKQAIREAGKSCSFGDSCPSGGLLTPARWFPNSNGEYCDDGI